ncbi:UNVERIFIED_CONTAM: hypothetical protein LBW93_04215 [Wolbachia endosymbiont of Nasonia longicornis]
MFANTCMPGGSFARYFLHGEVNCIGIVNLDLSGNTLSEGDIRAFITAQIIKLRCLILRNTGINDQSLKELSNVTLTDIEEIDLSNNSISGKGAFDALSNHSWNATVKVYLHNNTNIDEDHKIQIKASCGANFFFDLEYNASRNSSRNSFNEWSDNSTFTPNLICLRTSSPNSDCLSAELTKRNVPYTDNADNSLFPLASKDVASETPANAAGNSKEDASVDNIRINHSIYSPDEFACAANENLLSSTSDIAQNPVRNGTTLSKKRTRSPNVSPSTPRKFHKSNVYSLVSTNTEREILQPGGSSNFSSPQSDLEHPEISSVSGCSKGQNER